MLSIFFIIPWLTLWMTTYAWMAYEISEVQHITPWEHARLIVLSLFVWPILLAMLVFPKRHHGEEPRRDTR